MHIVRSGLYLVKMDDLEHCGVSWPILTSMLLDPFGLKKKYDVTASTMSP